MTDLRCGVRLVAIVLAASVGAARAEPVRVEAIAGATVTIDGIERGRAPLELELPPGTHEVVATAGSYEPATVEIHVLPRERAVVTLGMVRRRDVRLTPVLLGAFPLRTDTPFGAFDPGIAVQALHDIGSLKLGATVEYHARVLNSAGVGAVATWCPQRFAGRAFAWCPVTGVATWVFGERADRFDSGYVAARAVTAAEARWRAGFARLGVGIGITDYRRVADDRTLVLVSTVVELSLGVDL